MCPKRGADAANGGKRGLSSLKTSLFVPKTLSLSAVAITSGKNMRFFVIVVYMGCKINIFYYYKQICLAGKYDAYWRKFSTFPLAIL